jgi:hypothetical protein
MRCFEDEGVWPTCGATITAAIPPGTCGVSLNDLVGA